MLWAWECIQSISLRNSSNHTHPWNELFQGYVPVSSGLVAMDHYNMTQICHGLSCCHFNTRKIHFKTTWVVFSCLCIHVQRLKTNLADGCSKFRKSSHRDGLGLYVPDMSGTKIRKKSDIRKMSDKLCLIWWGDGVTTLDCFHIKCQHWIENIPFNQKTWRYLFSNDVHSARAFHK